MLFEMMGDCSSCRVQGAVAETWDTEAPPHRFGLPISSRCRLCNRSCEAHVDEGRVAESGCPKCGSELDDSMRDAHRCAMCGASGVLRETSPPMRFESVAALDLGLARWAQEEGLGHARELLESSFVLQSPLEIFAAISRGEVVETTFDVTGFLFSANGFSGSSDLAVTDGAAPPDTLREPVISTRPPSLKRFGGPREALLALASVAAADGETKGGDLEVLARAAARRGLPMLHESDVRVWRAGELDPPPTLPEREQLLEEMFQLAWADGEMDDSELRVIRDYARAWGIDPARVREWVELYNFAEANAFTRWLRRIGLFIFPR